MSKKELKEEVLKWVKSQGLINRKFFSVPIQKFIEFNTKGLKHAISRNYNYPEIEIQLLKNIPQILPNSHYMGFEKNTKTTDKNIKGVHNYYDIVCFEKELFEVWLKVKETKDKTYFYDFGIIRKI